MEQETVKELREYVIVMDKKTGIIKVLTQEEYYEEPSHRYYAIDDSDSEYKARLKSKEINSMGIQKYEEYAVKKAISQALSCCVENLNVN